MCRSVGHDGPPSDTCTEYRRGPRMRSFDRMRRRIVRRPTDGGKDQVRVTWAPQLLLSLWRIRWKVLEHLLYTFVEVLRVLGRIIGERIAGRASPDQFLRFCIEEIDQ